MPEQEKIHLMIRLAMLERSSGKQIRKAGTTSRIDLVTNPAWRWGFVVTLLFFAAAGIFAALNTDMVLDVVAKDQTKNLIMIVLIAWLSLLAVTVVTALALSSARTRKNLELREKYQQMLKQLERTGRMTERYDRPGQMDPGRDDLWEEPSGHRRRAGRNYEEEDLDYRHMQVLEFEDDEYCYYVEAVPKRIQGGRRG